MEAFYILGALEDRLNYLYNIELTLLKLFPLTPSSGSILWTLAIKEKLQMQIVYTWLGKNYDKVYDDYYYYYVFFFWEKWMMKLLCTIVYSMHLMEVKLDSLSGGKSASKRPRCEDKIPCMAKVFCFVSMYTFIYLLKKIYTFNFSYMI